MHVHANMLRSTSQLGDIASTKLRNILNKTERVLITVESHQATIEAFALMVELQVSGVAIIDPTTDAMVGAISLKDLRVYTCTYIYIH